MIWLVPVLLAAGCALALVAAHGAARLQGVAQMLAATWAGANLLWLYDALYLLPLFDLAVGLVAVRIWSDTVEDWALALSILSFYRLASHVINWITDGQYFIGYAHALSAFFALQLLVVINAGGINDRIGLLRWVRRVRRVGSIRQTSARKVSDAQR